MNITRRDVLRRLAGVATAGSLWASTTFVLNDDIPASVAGRFAQGPNPGNAFGRNMDIPRRQTTTTAAPGTTAGGQDTTSTTNPGEVTTTTPGTTSGSNETTTTATTQPPATTAAPKGESFTIMLRGLDPVRFWWDARYDRQLPYTPNVGWVDGDRLGYRCAWMFLDHGGQMVGRVTFARIPDATYAAVNDRSMNEGSRYFDGTLAPSGTQQTTHVSFGEEIVDVKYEEFAGDDQRPTIKFVSGGDLLEVRDYKKTRVENGIKFRQVSASGSRVTVVAYENNLPVVVIYYDSIHPSVSLTTDI
jgi:hypothetical protein